MKRLLLLSLFSLFALPAVASAQAFSYSQQKNVTVGATAVTYTSGTAGATIRTPLGDFKIGANAQLVSRTLLTFCVSKSASQAAGALVTISLDGSSPTTAGSDPGVVLAVGDCVSFRVAGDKVPKLISTQASTIVLAFEGIGS